VLKIAIIHENDPKNVMVAFDQETFIELLEEYYNQYHDIAKAVRAVEFDLKKKTLYK
jgi:hypothetical protein